MGQVLLSDLFNLFYFIGLLISNELLTMVHMCLQDMHIIGRNEGNGAKLTILKVCSNENPFLKHQLTTMTSSVPYLRLSNTISQGPEQ